MSIEAEPVAVHTENGRVTGIEVGGNNNGRTADQNGRRRAEIVEGSEHIIPCDAVIVAFGFAPHQMPFLADVGVTTDARGRIEAKGEFKQQTANLKVFCRW